MSAATLDQRAHPRHRPAPTPRTRANRNAATSRVALHLALAAYCLTSVGAFVWCLMVSLKTNPEFFASSPWSPPRHPSLHNYVDAWTTGQIGSFFLNSLYVTSVSVTVSLLLGLMAAYVLARVSFVGRNLARLVFLSGLMMPGFLVIVPLYFLLRNLHLLGSLTGLAIVYVATQIPFNVFVLMGFFTSLPKELEEAAYVDGASPSRTFFSIVVPQTTPAIASVAVLNCLTIWNEFFFALVFLTNDNRQTVPIGILGLSIGAEYSAAWVQLFAGLVLTMIPVLVVFAVAQDRIAKGLAAGALKG